jgi:hypothetical protein
LNVKIKNEKANHYYNFFFYNLLFVTRFMSFATIVVAKQIVNDNFFLMNFKNFDISYKTLIKYTIIPNDNDHSSWFMFQLQVKNECCESVLTQSYVKSFAKCKQRNEE